mgnify:CR=1 FL=1
MEFAKALSHYLHELENEGKSILVHRTYEFPMSQLTLRVGTSNMEEILNAMARFVDSPEFPLAELEKRKNTIALFDHVMLVFNEPKTEFSDGSCKR